MELAATIGRSLGLGYLHLRRSHSSRPSCNAALRVLSSPLPDLFSRAVATSVSSETDFLGHPQGMPVVRLRGLPFNCSVSDVVAFLQDLDVVDILLAYKKGRFTGEAFCVLSSFQQAGKALQRNRQVMGSRYIEVFQSRRHEYYYAIAAVVSESGSFSAKKKEQDYDSSSSSSSSLASASSSLYSEDRTETVEHTGVLRLRGLPFSVTKRDLLEFFRDHKLSKEDVHIITLADGRPTGEAFVDFRDPAEAEAAMDKDKMMIGSRYIELFPSSRDIALRLASKTKIG